MTTNVKGALLAATATLGLAAGSAGAETFALVQINQQALFFNQMNEGATAAAEEQGNELVIFNANNDPAAQNSAIETYIAQGVDGIVVVAIDVNGIMPAVQQAVDAGIPVVAVDAVLPEGGIRLHPHGPPRPARERSEVVVDAAEPGNVQHGVPPGLATPGRAGEPQRDRGKPAAGPQRSGRRGQQPAAAAAPHRHRHPDRCACTTSTGGVGRRT